jgi:putative molybdopterin biosynthesis protein
MSAQEQFLNVIDRDEAERRFRAALRMEPLGKETVPLEKALGRMLARDVAAAVDVPSFDRSNFDGFAVRAADTVGAEEQQPCVLELLEEALPTGVVPRGELQPGTAMTIATGAMLPRGADAVVMVEHTECGAPSAQTPSPQPSPRGRGSRTLSVYKAVTPGFGVSFAGTDISAGEIVLRRGELLTSRETGVLAAIGVDRVSVWRRPCVAILSTGDELLEPGEPMRPAMIYDSNAQILADAVREAGGEPLRLGIVPDDLEHLRKKLLTALERADIVLLSGGTSKGEGDLCYRAVGELPDPGIVAHGVALKPGKPICLAVTHGKPVVVLPGFPTSAIFTFHEFVAPVIRIFGGRPAEERTTVSARLAVKVNSEIGRTEYLLVGLVEAACVEASARRAVAADDGRQEAGGRRQELVAYPMGKGSGSVTAFSRADGFITIGRHEEIVEAGTLVDVQLLGRELRLADLVVIGSHCVGLDFLLSRLQERGFKSKFLAVGSTAGLHAAKREECDLAGIHLLDPATGEYNTPFLTPDLELIPGYSRCQGLLFRRGDERFEGRTVESLFNAAPAIRHSALRTPHSALRASHRRTHSLRHGQPQPRQRHADSDRPPVARGTAAGLRRPSQESQRRGCRRGARPGRLGRGYRARRPASGLGLPAHSRRAVRFCHSPLASVAPRG